MSTLIEKRARMAHARAVLAWLHRAQRGDANQAGPYPKYQPPKKAEKE